MKLNELKLVEMTPYLHDGKYTPKNYKESNISDNTLAREFTELFTEDILGKSITFYLANGLYQVVGTYKSKKENDSPTNSEIYTLDFKKTHTLINIPADLKGKRILQVTSVFIQPQYRGRGLSSKVYISLAKMGFAVISDTAQFSDGKMLWKKLSKESHLDSYKIYILDDEYGFIKDAQGEVISYDGSNIDDAQIWTKDLDFSGEHILLTLVS